MSLFQFIASDVILNEAKNPYIEFISIKEAVKRNIKLADDMMNDEDIDKDKKDILFCDSDEHLYEINIFHDMYHSPVYAKEYSNKQHFSELQWHYTEKRAQQLINYLKEELKISDEIEIWSIWIDEHIPASTKSISINELSIKDIEFLNIFNGYDKPKGLIIKK
jgi:hypothetical protein